MDNPSPQSLYDQDYIDPVTGTFTTNATAPGAAAGVATGQALSWFVPAALAVAAFLAIDFLRKV